VSNNTTSGNAENGITLYDFPTGVTSAATFNGNPAADSAGLKVGSPPHCRQAIAAR